jgi:hypothetical protein
MAIAAKPQNITPDQKSFGARIFMGLSRTMWRHHCPPSSGRSTISFL